jgi:Rhs element Vgr protein
MPVVIEELQSTIRGAENPMVVTCTILVEEQEIESAISVVSVSIDREVNKIPSATIIILDGDVSLQDFPISNRDLFVPGKKIEIRLGYQTDPVTVFKGIITGQGNRISGGNTEIIVTCKDPAVKMTLTRRYAHFSDTTDSDVAEQIIGRYSDLQKEIESTNITHTNLVQYHLTDWDFLLHRFDLLGMFCLVEDGRVIIKKPDLQEEKKLDVIYGATLMEYDAFIDARIQSGAVEATSWDYSNQEVNSSAGAEPSLQQAGDIVAEDLSAAMDFETEQLRYTGKWSDAELKAAADARLQKRRLARIRGRIKFQGTAEIKPNAFITVAGVGNRYSGPLYVSAIHHSYEQGNWLCEAQLGLDPAWFAEKINPYHPTASQGIMPAIQGLHTGIVTDLEDPEGEFRVRIAIPAINETEEGVWARVATLDAGNNRGTYFRPEIGDEVIVGFLGDDPRQVVILGMLHSSSNASPLQPANDNHEKGYVSRSNFRLIFNDDAKSLTIQSPAGKKLLISDQDGIVKIEDESGNKLSLESSGISLEAAANLTLKAGGQLKIEAANISISGSATTDIKGGTVKIN